MAWTKRNLPPPSTDTLVHGEGPDTARVMFIGKSPGEEEVRQGRVWCGVAGKEFDRYLDLTGLRRADCFITNLYRHYFPKGVDPNQNDLRQGLKYLEQEVRRIKPPTIVPLGREATQVFLGNVDMERVHGIPYTVTNFVYGPESVVVFPIYNPAAGIHSVNLQPLIVADFEQLGLLLRGKIRPHPPEDQHPHPAYIELHLREDIRSKLRGPWVAIDTEGGLTNPVWGLSFTTCEGFGFVVRTEEGYQAVRDILNTEDILVILHNSLHDLEILARIGIYPRRYTDTMVMAFNLGVEPQGLKPLAYRHAGMEMHSYDEIVRDADQRLVREYLCQIMGYDWPKPSTQYKVKDGEVKEYNPQPIEKRVCRLLTDDFEPDCQLRSRWEKVKDDLPDVVEEVERVIGELRPVTLDDVEPPEKAVFYSGRDCDSTLRIFPILQEKIRANNLERVMEIDLGAIPMVARMQETGIRVDVDYLQGLGKEFGERLDQLSGEIQDLAGYKLNVRSKDQVAGLLYDRLRLPISQMTDTGARGKVNDECLQLMIDSHPVVPLLVEFAELDKLKNTYADKLPQFVGRDGRIHPKYRVTRVPSGRLSCSEPNLMAIPTRSEVGKKIRNGFVAGEGMWLGSWDLDQIEMRVMAHESGDPTFVNVFKTGQDIHAATASAVFEKPIEECGKGTFERDSSKNVGFGIIFLITALGVLRQMHQRGLLHWTEGMCQNLIDKWLGKMYGVRDFMDQQKAKARRLGYVTDMFGRRRYLTGVRSFVNSVRAEAERQAVNHPIQCLPASTRIRTGEGFVRIGDFKEGVVWTGETWAHATRVDKGSGELVSVDLSDGASFVCDTAHQLLVHRSPWPEWVNVMDLRVGDMLAQSFANQSLDTGQKVEDEEFWYWVGRYYGDGYFVNRKTPSGWRKYVDWAFGSQDAELAAMWKCAEFLERRGCKPKIESQAKGQFLTFRVKDRRFDKIMAEYGVQANQLAGTKRIADIVFKLDRSRRQAFVRGYYEADGTTRKKYSKGMSATCITSINADLLRDTQLILRSLGQFSYILGPYGGTSQRHFYRLHIKEYRGEFLRTVRGVTKLDRSEPVFTLSVDDPRHAFDSEGLISKNSGAQGIIKISMGQIWNRTLPTLWDMGVRIQPLLQIHDELIFEFEKGAEDVVNGLVWEEMCHPDGVELKVPIGASGKWKSNWGELK